MCLVVRGAVWVSDILLLPQGTGTSAGLLLSCFSSYGDTPFKKSCACSSVSLLLSAISIISCVTCASDADNAISIHIIWHDQAINLFVETANLVITLLATDDLWRVYAWSMLVRDVEGLLHHPPHTPCYTIHIRLFRQSSMVCKPSLDGQISRRRHAATLVSAN